MDTASFKQEMPPVGGYRPLNFERVLAKKFFTVPRCLFLVFGTPIYWTYQFRWKSRLLFARELEFQSLNNATEPCMLAERDREYLRQLRINRDEEAELMKNVPGWEAGTWYGQPLFRTVPESEIVHPTLTEYYLHTRLKFLIELLHFEDSR